MPGRIIITDTRVPSSSRKEKASRLMVELYVEGQHDDRRHGAEPHKQDACEEARERISRVFIHTDSYFMKLRDKALDWGIISVMHAWLATTNTNNTFVCRRGQPSFSFQKSRDKWWFAAAVIRDVIRAAVITNLSLSWFLTRDHRGSLHDSDADCWEVCEGSTEAETVAGISHPSLNMSMWLHRPLV